jgi:hypothetical protein
MPRDAARPIEEKEYFVAMLDRTFEVGREEARSIARCT